MKMVLTFDGVLDNDDVLKALLDNVTYLLTTSKPKDYIQLHLSVEREGD